MARNRTGKTAKILEKLEEYGFENPYCYRLGPCLSCQRIVKTFWIPWLLKWVCPECFYDELEASSPAMAAGANC